MRNFDLPDFSIGVASSHLTGNSEAIGREFKAGADFVSLKTTNGQSTRGQHATCDPHCREPEDRRIAPIPPFSAVNCETSFGYDFETYLKLLTEALQNNRPLLISVGYEVDEIKRTIHEIKEVVKDHPECPVAFELSLHHAQDKSVVVNRIKAAVETAKPYPLYVKISYYGGDYLNIARLAVENGAAGIIGINSLGPFEDINNILAPGQSGWLSGQEIANTSLEIARQVVDSVCGPANKHYIAVGGVDAGNIWRYFQVGANAVAVCTYLMNLGIECGLKKLKQALRIALEENGNPTVANLRKNISKEPVADLAEEQERLHRVIPPLASNTASVDHLDSPAHVEVNSEKCTACGVCVDACPEGAISIQRDAAEPIAAQISEEICEACGSCLVACARNAIDWKDESSVV